MPLDTVEFPRGIRKEVYMQGIIVFPTLRAAQQEGFDAYDRDLRSGELIVRRLANGRFEIAIVKEKTS